MKKIFSLIALLAVIFSCICMYYRDYIKKGHEEVEVLNTDVSINNIKSIIDIKDEIDDAYEEVPLGYNNGNIYIIKYDSTNKKLYNNNIFILNKDGSTKECEIKLPDNYSNCELSIYGDKIFGKDGYFNWQSGKEYKLLSGENDELSTNWYPVSGNVDYYLCVENSFQSKKYILYNINSNEEYKFECNIDSDDVINGIFYDDISKKFYVICQNNVVKEINFAESNFTLEKYDDMKVNDKYHEAKNEKLTNNSLNYAYCLEGEAYAGVDYNDKYQDSININQYEIADKFTEQLNNITLYGYDSFYKEYILIKKDDDKSGKKVYLAKLEKKGFDMLIEIPKIYGDDSKISIHMVDSQNVLVKEENYDKENKKIKNRYLVYNLAEYFQDNTNKLKNDNDKLSLKNAYKNINEYNDSNSKNKLTENEENKNYQEVEQTKPTLKDNDSKENDSNSKGDINDTQGNDYREHDSSWRKGNGDWYYYKDNDEKVIGWLKTERGWYYFYKDGVMQKDAIVVGKNGKEYKLGHDGLLLNPDSEIDYDYDEGKEKNKKSNDESTKDTHNIKEESNNSNETKEKETSKK
ncbi:cell wall-binding protein [uncultured Clostridium sp.]|uniref:cell wall-binding protein n=1 Tax=uncultured Clostridium sp. TaxID=59620 RepID=UPI0028EF6B3D|nr:cell wall-binding protein [uncultured Clostridium sp.]